METIKTDFADICVLISDISGTFDNLQRKIERLSEIHTDYVNSLDGCLLLTMDSFHFQKKLLNKEYTCALDLFKLFNNRMYGDYYKFYRYIHQHVIADLSVSVDEKQFPVYKDLEPKNHYEIDLVKTLHKETLKTISELESILRESK